MPCYYPIDGWRSHSHNDNHKYPVVFDRKSAQQDQAVKLPCGRCIGCRLENARQWALRCEHELTLHNEGCFLTLTYNDENLPTDRSVRKEDWQSFLKKYRKAIYPKKIRFMACGEYGDNQEPDKIACNFGRPHYHAIIFGHNFTDRVPFKKSASGEQLYQSDELDRLWDKGYASIGEANRKSAGYVARYITKKIGGEEAEDHYQWVDLTTGEVTYVQPEFALHSKQPGLGHGWFMKYRSDLEKGFLTVDGKKVAIPKYYLRLMEKYDDAKHAELTTRRSQEMDHLDPDNTLDRLRVKEEVKKIRTKTLERGKVA